MNSLVQTSLSDVESKLNALLTTITTSPAAAGAPTAAAALLESDDALTSAVETLRRHQENYAKIIRLRAEAEQLEERVKNIVRNIEGFDKEIRLACGEDQDSDDDFDSDDGVGTGAKTRAAPKEIDYRLLLDFARRISKYNHEAAADAANVAGKRQDSRPQIADQDVTMAGPNGEPGTGEGAEPVSSVTKSATQWLDDSAQVTREVYMVPYPMEERIRMGLMGQVQLADEDPDKEVDRLIREAEGLGATEVPAPAPMVNTRQDEAAKAAAQAGSTATGTTIPSGPAPGAPKPNPKAMLDLDLYDPEDDEA